MRGYFNSLEVEFLLRVLREFQTVKRRQIANLTEEQEYLRAKIPALRFRFLYQGERSCGDELVSAKQRLNSVDFQWLPIYDRQATILHGLIVRFVNLQNHKRGRPPYATINANYALIDLYHKVAQNTLVT